MQARHPDRHRQLLMSDAWLWLGSVLLLAAAAFIAWFQPLAPKKLTSSKVIELRATDIEGKVRVDWDPRLDAIRDAQGGTLEAMDGGLLNRYPMEKRVLRSGSFDYIRQSDDVLLTMTLYKEGKPVAATRIRSVGPVPPAVAPAQLTTEQ